MKCSSDKVNEWIETFASFTDPSQDGYTRFSYTKEDIDARRYLISEMKKLGLEVSMDHVGNVFGRRPGLDSTRKPIVVGSHIDTVMAGGKYDGIAGVVAGLEVVRKLNDQGIELDSPLEVIAYMEEEGSRFGSAFIGSKWLVGDIQLDDLDDYKDGQGKTIASECSRLDALNGEVDRCMRKEFSPQATFELHIEQGPVLESKGNLLGVVDTITGSSAYQVVIKGEANHAGTIPMEMRKDAFVAASTISLELNRVAKEQPIHTVGTIGFLELKPNAYNIIPGQVDFSMDIRSLDQACMDQVTIHMKELIRKVSEESGLEFSISTKHNQPVVSLAAKLVDALKTSAVERNYGHLVMGSGAGHDTLVMAGIAPSAMVFVPSKNGRSHCPEEFTSAEEIAKGADLILDAVIALG